LANIRQKFEPKYFLYTIAGSAILMILFSAIFPNPKNIILNWDQRSDVNYATSGLIATDNEMSDYLWWVLGITKSIDAFIIGESNQCNTGDVNHLELTAYSVEKFLIIQGYENTTCAEYVKDLAPDKVEIVPENEVRRMVQEEYGQKSYPSMTLFKISAKIVVLLSSVILALIVAFMVWRAFIVKSIREIPAVLAWGYGLFFGMIGLYILCGTLASMPITYHAKNALGLIMSNYFLPGVVAGGNNLRTVFCIGALFLIIFISQQIYARIAPMVMPVMIGLILLILIIPQTEYFGKRMFLTFTSAEAYQWDYKQNAFNPFDSYKSIRDNNIYGYVREAFGARERGRRAVIYAESLFKEERWQESLDVSKRLIEDYEAYPDLQALGHYHAGEVYFVLRNQDIILDDYWDSNESRLSDFYSQEAISQYAQYTKIEEDGGKYSERSLFHRGLLSFIKGDREKALLAFQEYVFKYPTGEYIKFVILDLARLHQQSGQFDQATKLLADYMQIFSQNYTDSQTGFILAESQMGAGYHELAQKSFLQLIIDHPESTYNDEAWFKAGLAYEQLYHDATVKEQYREMMKEVANSPQLTSQVLDRLKNNYPMTERDYYTDYITAIKYYVGGNYDDAFAIYTELKKVDAPNAYKINILFRFAELYEYYGDEQKQRAQYNKVISDYPDARLPLLYAKSALAKLDNDTAALEGYRNQIQEYFVSLARNALNSKVDPKFREEQTLLEQMAEQPAAAQEQQRIDDLAPADAGKQPQTTQQLSERTISQILGDAVEQLPQKAAVQQVAQDLPVSEIETKIIGKLRRFYEATHPSRGMTLYFVSIWCLLILMVLNKRLRTVVLPLIFFFMARGMIRVGEQDPFRAVSSIWPGFKSAVQMVAVILLINGVIYIITNRRTIKTKAIQARGVVKSARIKKKMPWRRVSNLFSKKTNNKSK
ncbi:MAG: hypothetical protein ABIG66_02860, partial [Candidatus Kerfeldbacteria bacterium]